MAHLDIIDPIHDFVRVYEHELALVDSPLFQRLRRIRQLSGAHFTYPSAQHSRFEHSLGVMHIAGQAGTALQEKGILNSDMLEILRLAGLLHDIGHGPFSHPFEEAMLGKKIPHEEFGKQIILRSEIGDILSQNGYEKKLVASVAFGESKHQYLNEIISGALSADMMDYLLRDGYFTGAEHARIDHKRMIQSFGMHRGRLALEHSAQHSFESMMHSRYQMFKAVYFHKTVRAAEMMLIEALRSAADELGLATTNFDDFVRLADEYVLSKLISSVSPELERARQLARDYQDRRLPKCVFEKTFTGRAGFKNIHPEKMRSEISAKSRVPEDDIFVDSSATPSIPLAPSKNESKSLVLITKKNGKQTAEEMPISDIPIVSAIAGYMNVLRVYTHQKHRKKVEIAARSIIGDAR